MKKLLVLSGLALSLFCVSVQANPINGDFEAGLTGWSTLGVTSTTTGTGGVFSTTGSGAFLSTSHGNTGASVGDLETALGLGSGSLATLSTGNAPTEGSLISQTWNAVAGEELTFDFLFITDEEPGGVDDVAFISILVDGLLTTLASVDGTSLTDPSTIAHGAGGSIWGDIGTDYSGTGIHDSGWLSFSHTFATSGVITLGIGIFDNGDTIVESGLFVDNIATTSVPAPATLLIFGLGLLGFGVSSRRRS